MKLPSTLLQRLNEGKVLPFAGAGVSMSVTSRHTGEMLFPSWRRVLESAADKLEEECKPSHANVVRSLVRIESPDLLYAANHAQQHLGATWFEFLRSQFDHTLENASVSSLQLAQAVWGLGSNLVVTTNYDRVLRWACPAPEDLMTWSIDAPAEQAAVIREGAKRPTIWHLHGNIEDAADMILTPGGYGRLYGSPQTESKFAAALATLQTLLSSHSFLFIGFSLTDEEFGYQLKAVSENFSGAPGPHYALLPESEIGRVQKGQLPGVEFVSYASHGQPLLDLLALLANSGPKPSGKRNGSSMPTRATVASRGNVFFVEMPVQQNCDTPPPILTWVGRDHELGLLANVPAKVVAITGIGGQGKSTLVAKYLGELEQGQQFWDWRDCKEESNTLHTHLVRIIERLTGGSRRAEDLASETTASVVKLVLNLVLPLRGVFIFDNIDQYVDVYKEKAVEAMNLLIEGFLKSPSACKLIITTRPELRYQDPNFLQIRLVGLPLEDAIELFESKGLRIEKKVTAEIHELTQGHPLWLSLIAKQVLTNKISIPEFISRVRNGRDAGLPDAMLQEVWMTLNVNQKKLLRYLAEMVRPETVGQIGSYVTDQLNFNKFSKAMRQLKSLDLVVVKTPQNAPETIELHPLLREFVRRQFTKSERSPYISAIIVFLDRILLKLKTSFREGASFEMLQSWSARVELLINKGEYTQALASLDEASNQLLKQGYSEEFARLAIALFTHLHTPDPNTEEQKNYDSVFERLVDVLTQLGRFGEAEYYIGKFEQTVAGATARFVALCNMRAYFYWFQGMFDVAKEWGRRGVELKRSGNLDTRHDCGHNLALSQRDSGEIDEALSYFLRGQELADVEKLECIDFTRGGSYYGNIGRCLFFAKKYDAATACLLKSAWLLEKKDDESMAPLNRGWAACWLGDLFRERQPELAYLCYRRAYIIWKTVSPPRAEQAMQSVEECVKFVDPTIEGLSDVEVEAKYLEWLGKLKFTQPPQ